MYISISIIFFLVTLGLSVACLKGKMMPGLIFFSFSIGLESFILGLISPKIGDWQIIATIVVIAATSLAEIRSRKIPRTAFFITLIAVSSVLGIALFSAAWVSTALIVVAAIAMFCSPKGSSCGRAKRIVLLALAIATILLVCVLSLMTFTPRQSSSTAASETKIMPTITPTPTSTPTPTQSPVETKVEKDLVEAGLPAEDIRTGSEVIFAEDSSTTGDGAINTNGARTVEEMYAFLATKDTDPEAKMSYDFLVSKGKATDKMIYDRGSWATVQIGVDFGLPGNTGSINQKLTELGYREGKPGDILLVFYNAEDDIFVYFRGACANPQTLRPVPVLDAPTPTTKAPTPTTNPTPTPTPTLAPKDPSKDSAAKGNAPVGSGVNQDPGPGNYVAPTAAPTPPVESRVNPTPPAPTVPTAAPTAATTAAPIATPTPVDVAVGDPTSVGTPAIPN